MHKEFYSFLSSEIQVLIEKHKEDLDVNNPRDFIDYFLVAMENRLDLDEEDQEENIQDNNHRVFKDKGTETMWNCQ